MAGQRLSDSRWAPQPQSIRRTSDQTSPTNRQTGRRRRRNRALAPITSPSLQLPSQQNRQTISENETSEDRTTEQTESPPRLESPTKCPICLLVPTIEIWTPCAHLYCRHCLARCLQADPRCAYDRRPCNYEEIFGHPPCEADTRSPTPSEVHRAQQRTQTESVEDHGEMMLDAEEDMGRHRRSPQSFRAPRSLSDDFGRDTGSDAPRHVSGLFAPITTPSIDRGAQSGDPVTETTRFYTLLHLPLLSYDRLLSLRDQYVPGTPRYRHWNELARRASAIFAEINSQRQRQSELVAALNEIEFSMMRYQV